MWCHRLPQLGDGGVNSNPRPFALFLQSPIQLHLNSPLLHIDISNTIYDIYCTAKMHALPKCSTCSHNEDRSLFSFFFPPLLQARYVQSANEAFAFVTHFVMRPNVFATPETSSLDWIAPAVSLFYHVTG